MNSGKLQLPNVTLAAMTSVSVYETVKALEYSMKGIDFGEVVLISHKKPFYLPKSIKFKYTDRLTNIDDFNYKIVYDLCDYIVNHKGMELILNIITNYPVPLEYEKDGNYINRSLIYMVQNKLNCQVLFFKLPRAWIHLNFL